MPDKNQPREYRILAHISAFPNGGTCGYGSYISLSPRRREILYGLVSRQDAPAFAVYAELSAIKDTVAYLVDQDIQSASIKINREKAVDVLTGNAAVPGCADIAKDILGLIGDRNITFAVEPENKNGTAYIMAKRAAGRFDYKDDYRWRTECDKNVSDTIKFAIQEFYTRSRHEDWEYAFLGHLCNSLDWTNAAIGLPISVKKTVDLYFKDPEKQNIAARMYYCGMTPKDACKCAIHVVNSETGKECTFRELIRKLVKKKDNESKVGHLSDRDLEDVTDLIANGYPHGENPLRSPGEAIEDVYLSIMAERESSSRPKVTSKTIISSKDNPVERCCDCCGKKLAGGYQCKDREIVNVLLRKGWNNRFCSVECFIKTVGLVHVA